MYETRSCSIVALLTILIAMPLSTLSQTPEVDSTLAQVLNEATSQLMGGKVKESIPVFQSVLERDPEGSALGRDRWHSLILNLGAAYGMSGDFESSEKTFIFGLSKDSTYPLFYYNLACTYAEQGELDKSISQLRLAHGHRKNVSPEERIPDPESDGSFSQFLNDPKFIAAMAEFKGARVIPRVEYSGKPLPIDTAYSITRMGGGSTIYLLWAPSEEQVLVNLYDSSGQLEITVHQGKGEGVLLSLAMTLKKFDYKFLKGVHKLVLFGKRGRAECEVLLK